MSVLSPIYQQKISSVLRLISNLELDRETLLQKYKNESFPDTKLSKYELFSEVLESSEIARMKLVLQNHGPVDLHGVRISLFNLSGQQVQVKQQEYDIERIKVGGSEVLELPIAASSSLQKEQLDFGVSVTCSEIAQPINQSLFIKSSPKVASKHVSRTGH